MAHVLPVVLFLLLMHVVVIKNVDKTTNSVR
jgi:hypothetical protein